MSTEQNGRFADEPQPRLISLTSAADAIAAHFVTVAKLAGIEMPPEAISVEKLPALHVPPKGLNDMHRVFAKRVSALVPDALRPESD